MRLSWGAFAFRLWDCYSSLSGRLSSKIMVETAYASGDLRRRLDTVREKIDECVRRSGRSADDLTLVAVSKTHPAELVREAIAAGVTDFGENRVQEAEGKIPEVGRDKARWHLIGHLQSNKARRAGELSMGMTHDYEIGIEEGATMLRVGTAIFGDREQRSEEMR